MNIRHAAAIAVPAVTVSLAAFTGCTAGNPATTPSANPTTSPSDTPSFPPGTKFVTTLAGSDATGSVNGSGSAATFNTPNGMTIDSSGNLYVTDSNAIRKITPSGVVATVVTPAQIPGIPAVTQQNFLTGVAVDASGSLYVVDANAGNNGVYRISSTGTVTTLATSSILNPIQMGSLFGLAVDGVGNAYTGDFNYNSIYKISATGSVSILAGAHNINQPGFADGATSSANFNSPNGLALDASNNLYVADLRNYKIRKVTPAGGVSTVAGSTSGSLPVDGTGTAAVFANPTAIAMDSSGNAYVADSGYVRKVTPAGVVTTVAGAAGATYTEGGAATQIGFGGLSGIAVTPDGSKIYVIDGTRIKVIQ